MAEPSRASSRLPPLARVSASVLSATIASALCSFGFVLLVARVSGPATRGALAFATAVPTLLSFISTLGLENAALYFAAREPDTRPRLGTFVLLAGTATGLALATIAYGLFHWNRAWVPNEVSQALLLLSLAVVPVMTAGFLLMTLMIGSDRVGRANVARVSGPAIAFVTFIVVSIVVERPSVTVAVSTWAAAQGVAWVVTVVLAATSVGLARPGSAVRSGASALRYGLAAHAGNVADVATFRFDTLVLAATQNAKELGIYAAAVNVAEILLYLPTAASSVLLPAGAARERDAAGGLTLRVMLMVVALATIAAGVGIALATFGIRILYGRAFDAAVAPLRILLIAMLGTAARRVLFAGAAALRRQGWASVVSVLTLIAIVALDLALIPSRGAVGAAWASLAAYTVGGILMYAVFRRISATANDRAPSLRAEARALLAMLAGLRQRD